MEAISTYLIFSHPLVPRGETHQAHVPPFFLLSYLCNNHVDGDMRRKVSLLLVPVWSRSVKMKTFCQGPSSVYSCAARWPHQTYAGRMFIFGTTQPKSFRLASFVGDGLALLMVLRREQVCWTNSLNCCRLFNFHA